MKEIKVTAPISIEDLKKYFTDKETFYVIDYNNSKLKNEKLLTYLGNLDLPADIDLTGTSQEDVEALVLAYMKLPLLVSVSSLEKIVIFILAEAKGIIDGGVYEKFIVANRQLVDSWISKTDSLTLYNFYILQSDELKSFAESFPKDDTDDLSGINFVSLLKDELFYTLYEKIDQSQLKFYSKYFNDYMFKGKNLYSFWAVENNPLFILTHGISSGIVNGRQVVAERQDAAPV
jgi:hypothetical protein